MTTNSFNAQLAAALTLAHAYEVELVRAQPHLCAHCAVVILHKLDLTQSQEFVCVQCYNDALEFDRGGFDENCLAV